MMFFLSSNFELVVSEGLSSRINEIATTDFLRELASRPITEDNDFYTLEDVGLQDLNEISSKDVNMLFSIREVFVYTLFFSDISFCNYDTVILDWPSARGSMQEWKTSG
jgi:hypothetical protein